MPTSRDFGDLRTNCSRKARNPAVARSRQEIKGVGHPERALGIAAVEITLLSADVRDDGEAACSDLGALRCLEYPDRGLVAGLTHPEVGPTVIPHLFQICDRGWPLVAMATGDKEHCHILGFSQVEQ